MQDIVIKKQFMAFQKNENNNKKYLHFNYCYNNNILICYTIYQTLIKVSYKYLDIMIQYL